MPRFSRVERERIEKALRQLKEARATLDQLRDSKACQQPLLRTEYELACGYFDALEAYLERVVDRNERSKT